MQMNREKLQHGKNFSRNQLQFQILNVVRFVLQNTGNSEGPIDDANN